MRLAIVLFCKLFGGINYKCVIVVKSKSSSNYILGDIYVGTAILDYVIYIYVINFYLFVIKL